MARYVISHRRAGRFRAAEKLASRAAMEYSLARVTRLRDASVLADNAPEDALARRTVVFEANPEELAEIVELARTSSLFGSDVIIEPELLRWPSIVFPAPFRDLEGAGVLAAAPAGKGRAFAVEARSAGATLAHATVYLFLQGRGDQRTVLTGETDASGEIQFEHSSFWNPAAILVSPYAGAWGMVVRGPTTPLAVECPPLPAGAYVPWWHDLFRLDASKARRGAAIKVGVCDTGCGPHAGLDHRVDAGAFLGGEHFPHAGADADSHGTHVSGIIGGRAKEAWLQGVAPGSALYVARVFPPGGGASQADVSNAIDALSKEHHCDLINLSLGSTSPSEIERDAMVDAFERGTLSICAAGNDSGPVAYPASYDVAVAVSALGLPGWGPAEASANLDIPQLADRFGDDNLYLANFSCYGPEIDVAGPGVGILSNVPERHGLKAPQAEMSGTSMACPAVCGALAVLLAADPDYRALPRDSSRAAQARWILRKACREIGLDAEFEGYGVPRLK